MPPPKGPHFVRITPGLAASTWLGGSWVSEPSDFLPAHIPPILNTHPTSVHVPFVQPIKELEFF